MLLEVAVLYIVQMFWQVERKKGGRCTWRWEGGVHGDGREVYMEKGGRCTWRWEGWVFNFLGHAFMFLLCSVYVPSKAITVHASIQQQSR